MKKIATGLLSLILILSNIVVACAFENPPIIAKRGNNYMLNIPESNSGYVFTTVTTEGLSLYNPLLGTGYVLMNSSFMSPINSTQINNAKKAIHDLINGKIKDYSLEYYSPKKALPIVKGIDSLNTVRTTYKKLKNNLKNDTTDYKLNIVLNRKIGFTSKSRLGSIEAYNYSKIAVKELMNQGHIKVTMPKKGQSTYRAKITMTKYGKSELNKILRDKQKIIKYYETKNIK